MSKPLQVKLLRVLQEKTYEPLGATVPVRADVRIIVATNADIDEQVKRGEFRIDLYYRINAVVFRLPPLSGRRGDIPLLVTHFLNRLAALHHREVPVLSDDAMAALMRHSYPGNIRELENIVNHAFIMCTGQIIGTNHLPDYLLIPPRRESGLLQTLDEFESQRIRDALARNRFNRSQTALELGIHPATLWRKMKKLNLQ
jgi:transcriptional regulator with PAS, ATPase and Fis domain